ncbi:DNA polymerase IV [Agrobacterium vitis]|uniref:DNA polymerase IV n=1 Tax=Agrobacterium vitis TaxID=373 RepID=UPI0008722306|nr:DNA polymerase IV [Agrobacterium vitis]MCE6077611.1 DNA polymerase IV [Agrobacterium vitis]MCM2470428.1 DNA polymerase IV [Agrobacterium vitis]MUO72233.1 DNA polymerase IV [Agrobacterium vitis]MUO87269.1 DNA polymerase IV [Agrobacterium vitis]MVA36081.1 DNA polymerase IV [Agrobacterium vitis]
MSAAPSLRSGFCRDCLSLQAEGKRRCTACGSPRLVYHPELFKLTLAHIDCDAFYASVEKRDNPDLIDKPLIIGGGKRGVVSTACYVARIHGVRSAMPMFKALEACPNAVVIPPNMEKYARVGRQVRAMMEELTPLVQPLSIDEAFLELKGTETLHHAPPALVLARLARRIESEIGITVSVGLSYCKFLAKVASDLQKPRGFSVIGEAEALEFLAPRPVTTIWGVGKAFASTLEKDGIRTIGQLQTMEESDLIRRYGSMGQRLARLSKGIDDRDVHTNDPAKSVSAETTFFDDISRREDLVPYLRKLSEKVAWRLKKQELAGHTVILKLKSADFKLRTRNRRLDDPTQLADRIFRTGLQMLDKEADGTKFRLIGIGVSDFANPSLADPPDLVDPDAARRAKAEAAMDQLRTKFGKGMVETGFTFGSNKK